jgi:nascent polypeptide-associated complex subunit alpha
MFGGFGGGLDPKKMQAMMKQLGIKQEQIDSLRVIIEKSDGKIIIENPNVTKIVMQGQESFQITGEVIEESGEGLSEDDVQLVMEKTGKSRAQVLEALDETKDIAEAIVKLSD